MSSFSLTHHRKAVGLIALVAALVAGCQKKDDQAAIPAPAPTVETSSASPTTAATSTSSDGPPISTDIRQSLSETDAAIRAGAYQTAAQNLLAVQQFQKKNPLTPQQAQQVYHQMAQLQDSLAGAISRGDPNAKAAADLLRKSAMNR